MTRYALALCLLAGCTTKDATPKIDGGAVVLDTAPARRLGLAEVAATSCVTRADSLDARYLRAKLDTSKAKADTMRASNGGGRRNNLFAEIARMIDASDDRVAAQIRRLTAQAPCSSGGGTDTVRKTDTVTKVVTRTDTVTKTVTKTVTDTLTINAAVSPVLVAGMKVDLDSIDNDATAPAYSLRAQKRLKARVDSVSGGTPPPPPPPPVDTFPAKDTTTKDTATAPIRAALPKSEPAPVFAKATRTVPVFQGANLQTALNAAQPGDSLVLSGTWTGNFVLPTRPCGVGIQIVGAAPIPAAGMRATPQNAVGWPKIITPNSGAAIATTQPTCGWRIVGVEVTGTLAATSIQWGLFTLGDGGWVGGGEKQTTLAMVPRDIVLDRVWIHGSATLNTARCLAINSANSVVINSTLSDCHGTGFDSQALEGWNGPGPYLIENNYLEGAGENVMFGGADPGIAGLSPSDITIRRNHITKPLAWRNVWTVKNLTELKNARRVLYEGNVFGPTWPAGQESAIVFKSSQDSCGTCLWEGTQDVTFRYNIVRDAPVGLNLQAFDESGQVKTTTWTARVTVENNVFSNIGAEGRAALNLWTHPLADVIYSHNTATHAPTAKGLAFSFAYSGGTAKRISIPDNVLTAPAGYAVFYDGGIVHTAGLAAFASDKPTFTGNVVAGIEGQFVGAYPLGNQYPTIAALGLKADGSTLFAPAGANIAEVTRRTAGVVIAPPASAPPRAMAARAVTPTITRADSVKLAHQPKSRDPK